jgi:hypothetical protein
LKDFIGCGCQDGKEVPVLFRLHALCEYEQRPRKRDALQTPAALFQYALAYGEWNIRVMEMV